MTNAAADIGWVSSSGMPGFKSFIDLALANNRDLA